MCTTLIILGFLGLGVTELVLILLILLVMAGGKNIPGIMKGLGKGIRDFKKSVNEDDEWKFKSFDKKD